VLTAIHSLNKTFTLEGSVVCEGWITDLASASVAILATAIAPLEAAVFLMNLRLFGSNSAILHFLEKEIAALINTIRDN
jgi:hypothetical protein